MKDFDRETLEGNRPGDPPIQTISYCLEELFNDKTKSTKDVVVGGLSFEELIGALLQARDLAEAAND
ncbi:hypothetical protein ACYOEI_22800 [Singulisphaera rosea]